MKNATVRIGLDIAKNIFVAYGVDQYGNNSLKKKLKRQSMLRFFAQLPPATIGIESCGSSNYWGRELSKLGHNVHLIAPKYVKPYLIKEKNDLNDAAAICEAIGRPNARFVAIKTEAQQEILVVHRVRSKSISTRTALMNQIRGHLAEFGYVFSQGRAKCKKELSVVLGEGRLSPLLAEIIHDLYAAVLREEDRIAQFDKIIERWARSNPVSKELLKMDGIGALTASAVVATTGDTRTFKNGRQFSAWLGLVPRQYSSGGKSKLGRITKKGDIYLRTLLVHGARTVMLMSTKGRGAHTEWIEKLRKNKPDNVVAVAYAAKQARMLWAIMAKKENICCC
ncbi:IS110 family transposase [Dasania sp. GY-MA-18]|uniref:IS110 family transposase n=1 Tax=Dasania phycosphaerae TaxID=2950436 RepID=A0A9J6RMS6_9GAMM|nr:MULTISPECIES: IS110 family transposase [Dasania]MCR8923395.1 IS110 family transposase [Dasania sp. GY-MA-18]MCZ0865827.1 IS110 family transposase [Dasania phycosphaerae]MCZ0869552.1 IS110 family transposase [Dasania phycosphaerae]